MSDYTVRIEAQTEEAERKLKRVDERVVRLERGASIDIRVPSAQETLNVLQQISTATASVAKQALQISRAANIGPGAVINDLEDLFGIVTSGGKDAISVMDQLRRATPTNILGSAFSTASDQANKLSRNLASVGYEIFGLTQSVGILQQAFGGLFNETIGREIRLQESLLRTRTTLASTADIAVDGKRLTDPYEALMALEGPIDQVLENIRRRSLDIAGTTSDAIVQMFGVVAGQVGQFGGTLKDAEDLAITFAGALGTIGMANPTLAVQEVRSILTGTIDQNSVLARSLGLTNADIQKAKTSAEGLTAFLNKRLEAFTAGQKIAAQGFAGVTSNIEEVREEATRSLGKPMLAPLLEGLTVVYERLGLIFDQILSIGDGLGRIGAATLGGLMSGISAAPILEGFSERDQIEAFDRINSAVADVAVSIQNEIDNLRPLIGNITNEIIKAVAMVSQGLADLGKGFASYKFEQLKILAKTLVNIASLLNSTLIPTLSAVLSLYGKILEQPAFQYLTQVKIQLQVLEKVGVLSLVRLGYYWQFAFKESVLTAIGWVKTLGSAVQTGLTAIVNGIAGSISGIGGLIKNIGNAVIQAVTLTINGVLSLVTTVVAKIRTVITTLALQLSTSTNPALAQLGVVISNVGNAFSAIEQGAQKAQRAVLLLSLKGQQSMQNLDVAAKKAALATRTLGTALSVQLGGAIKALGGKLMALGWSFIKFQIILLAIQATIGVVTDAIARWQRAQDEISNQTRTELALKRLNGEYAKLGENASLAAKALKQVEEARLNTRASELDKKIEERAEAYLEAQRKLAEVDRYNQAVANAPTYGNAKPVKVSDDQYVQEIQAYERFLKQRDEIRKYFERQEQEKEDESNVQVLARERKDIETALGEFRKQLEKELNDERFRATRELASLEQSLKEEGRRAERTELERRLALEQQNLIGVQANIAQILGDYEKGLFDAQTEAQRKQYEATQARADLDKSIADYKYRLEEQTERLRKRLGDFNKQVADYETAQADRRNKERIQTELRAAAIRTERYVLTPEERNKFKDAAFRAGVSSSQALALLKMPGVVDNLGVQPGSNPDALIEALQKNPMLGPILSLKQPEFIAKLDEQLRVHGDGAGKLTYDTAVDELGNNRDFQRNIPAPPKLKGFEDFAKEQAQFVADRRSLGERILGLTQVLNELVTINNLTANLDRTLDALRNPNLFTTVPAFEAVTQETENLREGLRLFNDALGQGDTKISALNQELSNFALTVIRGTKTFVDSNPMFEKLTPEQREGWREGLLASSKLSLQAGTPTFDPQIATNLATSNAEVGKAITAFLQGQIDASARINNSVPAMESNRRLASFTQLFQQFFQENKNFLRNSMVDVVDNFSLAAADDSPLARREAEARMINMRRSLSFADSELVKEPEAVAGLAQMNEATRKTYTELGRFEEELKGITEKLVLAKDVASDFVNGAKNVFRAAIDGSQSITDALYGMLESVSDRIIGSFLDYAFKPLQQTIENNMQRILGVDSAEALEKTYRDRVLKAQETTNAHYDKIAPELDQLSNSIPDLKLSIDNLTSKIENAGLPTGIGGPDLGDSRTSGLKYGIKIGDFIDGPALNQRAGFGSTPQQPSGVQELQVIPAPQPQAITAPPRVEAPTPPLNLFNSLSSKNSSFFTDVVPPGLAASVQDELNVLTTSTGNLSEKMQNIGKSTDDTDPKMKDLQQGVGAAAGAMAGIAMIAGGVAGMKEGGTYGTLMGLASIFGGIASITGSFASLGSIKGNARGGPLTANTPYLVGEEGPELFVPNQDGEVNSTSRTQALLAARSALGGNQMAGSTEDSALQMSNAAVRAQQQLLRERSSERTFQEAVNRPSGPLDINFQSEVINNVEYVTADQFQRGMSDAANRGYGLTMNALRNSVKARQRVGLGR
jgi:hypothetical protein